jgi:methylated-DNA-[protein]-cysteine S-methyltransferase
MGMSMNRPAETTWTICESPIGALTAVAGPSGITTLHFSDEAPRLPAGGRVPMLEVVGQLEAYFAGERRAFELELDLRGDPLQRQVWERLLAIPYGETTTYGALAREIDDALYPRGLAPYERPRAVGAAIGRNPVPVVVGCHRVIGADGSLTGYRGGLERKRMLLELEGSAAPRCRAGSAPDLQLPLL